MKIGYLMEVGEDIRQPPFNGPANHVRQIAAELIRKGHTVRILFRLGDQIWLSENLQSFNRITVRASDGGLLRWIERIARKVQSILKLPYLAFFESLRFALACRQELSDCDVWIERLGWMAYGCALAARWMRVPWILEFNGDPLHDLEAKGIAPAGLQRWLAVRLTGAAIRSANCVVATGEGWRKNSIIRWGVDEKRTVTIENGTDLLGYLEREDLKAFQPISLNEFSIQIAYLGGFYPWHGIHILLQAASKLTRLGVDLRLVLIGSGDGLNEAKQLAAELGIEGRVSFLGRLQAEAYASILAQSDFGVSPYCGWAEYSGLKIYDYKAAGLVCVASGENGQPATLAHGETGWIVPPCDEDALVEAILVLASQPERKRKIGQAARIEAEQRHAWSHTADHMVSVMETLTRREQRLVPVSGK